MLVSIFIPTYNATKCIEKTLESVLGQTYQNIEVWLVDDCSTDETPQLLDVLAEKDSRIKVLHKEKNEGFVPFSWNRVFPLLQGEYTFYMSHDDTLSLDCIEKLVETQKQTGAECIIPTVRMGEISTYQYTDTVISGKTAFAKMLNYDIPGFALWKTDLIRKIGMPTEAFNSDEGMQRIWALNCNKVAFCPEAEFYYYLTPESITKGLKPYHLTGLKTQQRLIKTAFANGIWWNRPKETSRFVWQYLKSYRYLKSNL